MLWLRIVGKAEHTFIEITRGTARAYRFPTESRESDGTLSWNSTTMVFVELEAGGKTGLGYTYSHGSAAELSNDLLEKIVLRQNALDVGGIWERLVRAERNWGRVGLGAMAISAIDVALWDLKAKLLHVPLSRLLGHVRDQVPVYGSGGFTSYSVPDLIRQLAGWVEQGIPRVKMKIGLGEAADRERVRAVRAAIGPEPLLFVDANEAYRVREAISLAQHLVALGVSWFEQPISAEDLGGMRFLRERLPAALPLTTGEYLSDTANFREVILAGAADILQPDVTRCRGITGFLKAAALCESFHVPVSSHCAPALHLALGCAVPNFAHLEYFHDHVRIERMIFEGVPEPRAGALAPDLSRNGLGIELKRKNLERHAA